MEKYSRNERIAIITKVLIENPNRIMSLNYFGEMFNAAKSTISEDILIVREIIDKMKEGKVETIAGASGGVKYVAGIRKDSSEEFQKELISHLSDRSRIVPGNFLYVTDLMQNPRIISKAGAILAQKFFDLKLDYIITVETKGIPLAYEVARYLGVQLIVVRRNSKITEGTSVSINYLTGTQGMLSVMSLSKRSIRPGSKLVFIDDFLRGGGTVKGIMDLLAEFDSSLIGVGVVVNSLEVNRKLDTDIINFADYYGIDENGNIKIEKSDSIF